MQILNNIHINQIKELLGHVEKRRHKHIIFLILFSLISSITEVISLGAIVPFINGLTAPENILNFLQEKGLNQYFHFQSAKEVILPFTIIFVIASFSAAAVRLIMVWFSINLSNAIGSELSTEVFRRTLYQPYVNHLSQSSSEVISGVTQKVGTVTTVLLSLVTLITSSILFISILGTLIFINPQMAVGSIFSLGGCYLGLAFLVRKKLKKNSTRIAIEQTNVIRTLQEGLGAIRDVQLEGSQEAHSLNYSRSVTPLMQSGGENTYINQAPRFIIESVAMFLIATFAYLMNETGQGIGASLSTLAALGLGAQRLMPLLQNIYGNWSVLMGSHTAMTDVLSLLRQNSSTPTQLINTNNFPQLDFNNKICFEDINYHYPNHSQLVLSQFNLTIKKGERIGIIGASGSGKSTTLDLLMGLLTPTSGKFYVDQQEINFQNIKSWQKMIAHVPQSVFLNDCSIAENIAFGIPMDEIDMEKVQEAAIQAHLADFIESCPLGYKETVGERGARLSGGQRQRIGIARALYKNAKVLILDEATSALDSQTEGSIMKSIYDLSRELTIVMVSHRYSNLAQCDNIIFLSNGQINSQGSFEVMKKALQPSAL